MGIIKKLFNYSEKEVKRVMPLVEKINGLESSMQNYKIRQQNLKKD